MADKIFINDIGIVNALGTNKEEIFEGLIAGNTRGFQTKNTSQGDFTVGICEVDDRPAISGAFKNRLNNLLSYACDQIKPSVGTLIKQYGADRIGVVLGTTDNGSEQALNALAYKSEYQNFHSDYSLEEQTAHNSSAFVKSYLQLKSISMNISTACTSSARAVILGRQLIQQGVCDAVICGGGDIVSDTVLLGFNSLEAVDREHTNPFSANRKGINLGEGAALLVLSKDTMSDDDPWVAGCGDSSDAHHMTGPHPQGEGAIAAMKTSLQDAGLEAGDIDYLNLHGTGTRLNDSMESIATAAVFSEGVPCSSTKPLVGHTLGAAGATELAFACMLLSNKNSEKLLPPHIFDNQLDPEVPSLQFVRQGQTSPRLTCVMSNSYAFGGSNVSLIIRKDS